MKILKRSASIGSAALTALATFAAVTANSVTAQGIAFITDLKGEANLGGGKAAIMAEVGRGARISCLKECQVGVMYLVSGKEFMLKGPGDFVVGDADVAAKIGAPPKVRDTQWKVSAQTVNQAAQTSNASIRMRSISGGITGNAPANASDAASQLLYPVQTSVASLQPPFRWASEHARGPFEFELKTSAAPEKTVYKAKAGEAMLKLPNSAKLKPDTEYSWTVKYAGAEIGNSSFKTLAAPAMELAQKRKPLVKAEFSDWLMYGLTLREVGASQDASEVFGKLAIDRPDLPELAKLAQSTPQ